MLADQGVHPPLSAAQIAESPLPPAQLSEQLHNLQTIVVAIHGIGKQQRGATIRSVARLFGDRETPKLPVQPLGHYHVGSAGEEVQVTPFSVKQSSRLHNVGLVEVFWADIPQSVVASGDTLEETKQWVQTVVSRAHAQYQDLVPETKPDPNAKPRRSLTPGDFTLGANVLSEAIETIDVLEKLLFLFDRLNLFHFDLGALLRDYVGDVQIVTEFAGRRKQILDVFHNTMQKLVSDPAKPPNIHIVAHSEGSVIAFLGLLNALNARAHNQNGEYPSWIDHVRGFMTIGSPIDKHIVLWPHLFAGLRGDDKCKPQRQPIRWRNYYDYGDPVGFKLDSARDWLEKAEFAGAFDFKPEHDIGFSRYWLPGKAHNDYWKDEEVFEHFFSPVLSQPAERANSSQPPRPKDRWFRWLLGTALPYFSMTALHMLAVWLLGKGFAPFRGEADGSFAPATVVGVGLMLTGSTVAARIPRLLKPNIQWGLASLLLLCLSLAQLMISVPSIARSLAATGALLALVGWMAPRWPRWGRGSLVVTGLVALVGWVSWAAVTPSHGDSQPLWPVLLSAASALYAWWLGILLFDLTFIWQRYIRESVAVDVLHAWTKGEDAKPRVQMWAEAKRVGHSKPAQE